MRRPRTVSFEPDEMEELGKEMLSWVIENKPMHLSQWYSMTKLFTYNQWKSMQLCQEFHPYYECALQIVGLQYLAKDSPIDPGIKQRWQRVYFKDLKQDEDEKIVHQARANAEAKHELEKSEKADIPESLKELLYELKSSVENKK